VFPLLVLFNKSPILKSYAHLYVFFTLLYLTMQSILEFLLLIYHHVLFHSQILFEFLLFLFPLHLFLKLLSTHNEFHQNSLPVYILLIVVDLVHELLLDFVLLSLVLYDCAPLVDHSYCGLDWEKEWLPFFWTG